MSHFNNKSITNKGLELLSTAMAGGKLEFTRIVMGSGTYSGDIGVIESLVNQKQSLDIKSITKKGSQVILSTTLLQSAITEDFYWKEIGVYAKGTDNLEVLYMYGSATDTSFISKDMLNEKMINIGVLGSNAQNITATIDGSLVYLSRADLEEHNTSESAHSDIRELINSINEQVQSIDVSWDSITGKPESMPANGGNADTVGGKHASEFVTLTGDQMITNVKEFRSNRVGADFGQGAIQLRETNGVATASREVEYAPALAFHWSGTSAASLAMHADGAFHFRGQGFSSSNATYKNVIANDFVLPDGTGLQSLKSSVVSGKQEVVNAINDKLGYVSGLTTSHPFADLAWWIRNKITGGKTLISQMTFTCASRQNNSDTYNVTQEEIFSTGFEDSATNRSASGMYVIEFNMNAGSGSVSNPDFLSATVNGNTTFFNEDRKTTFVVFANANLCTDSRGAQLKNAIVSTIKFSWRMGYSNIFSYAPIITVKYYHVDVAEFFK